MTVNDEHELRIVKDLDGFVWVGLETTAETEDKSMFAWITREPVTGDFWASDQPSGGEAELCVLYDEDLTGWADRDCKDLALALCERP